MRVTYRYECEVCGEFESLTFDNPEEAPVRITCTVCGLTNRMIKLQPRPAIHNGLKGRR